MVQRESESLAVTHLSSFRMYALEHPPGQVLRWDMLLPHRGPGHPRAAGVGIAALQGTARHVGGLAFTPSSRRAAADTSSPRVSYTTGTYTLDVRNDAQTDVLLGLPKSAICVQRFDDSLNSAIHITYRSLLRSSSMHEPRDPPLKVVRF